MRFVGALLGAEPVSGTVEGVEIMRTLVRTSEGTLVAVPNKLVAELVVFNRTRSLTGVPRAEAAAVAAAAPLRRVLCFNIQLDRWAVRWLVERLRACASAARLLRVGFACRPTIAQCLNGV